MLTKDRSSVWSTSLSDQRWHLPRGYYYPLKVRFDEGPWLDLESAAESTSVLRIVLPPDGTLLAMIRHGHSIQITSGSFDKRYDLEGSADALERLETCVRDHLAEEVAARESARATSQTLLAVGTVGVALYLAPLLPMLVVAEVASPDYHPSVIGPPAETDVDGAPPIALWRTTGPHSRQVNLSVGVSRGFTSAGSGKEVVPVAPNCREILDITR